MKRIGVVLFFIFVYIHFMHAQYVLKGNVVDESAKGIPYATVQLTQIDSSFVMGTITDSIGNYELKKIKGGHYLLFISAVGYNTHKSAVDVEAHRELSSITLEKSNITLGEVVIKASSFIRQKDRILILPTKQQIKHAHTGYDLLYNLMLPNINVDRRKGSVSTFSGEVSLYINGQKASTNEVQGLRPSDIEKIEYFDMPTGKYSGDKVSINYVMKHQDSGGYLTLNGTQNLGYKEGDYNTVAKLNHKKTNYTFFGGYSMTEYSNMENKLEDFYFPDQNISRITWIDKSRIKNKKLYAQFNVENQTEKRTLSGKISFTQTASPDNFIVKNIAYNGGKDQLSSNSMTDSKDRMPTLKLYGDFNITSNQNLQVTFQGNYIYSNYVREYSENNYYSYTQAKDDLYNLLFDSRYNIRLKHQNSLGIRLNHLHKISSTKYSGDYSQNAHLWTAETLLTGQYNQIFNKRFSLNIQFGGDLLQYSLHHYKPQRYLSAHVNAMLNYRIAANQSLMYVLNTGNSNPPINRLSDIDQNIDSIQVKRGNPYLAKSNYYITYLVYSMQVKKLNFQAVAYYSGAIPTSATDYYSEGEKIINSFRSDGNYHNVKSALSVTYNASPSFQIGMNLFYRFYKITGKVKASENEWMGRININYYRKNLLFNVYGESAPKTVSMEPAYTRGLASYGIAVSWNHNNWNIETGIANMFNKHKSKTEYLDADVYQFHRVYSSKRDQCSGYLKIAYTFDFGKKVSRSNEKIDIDINSAILKAE